MTTTEKPITGLGITRQQLKEYLHTRVSESLVRNVVRRIPPKVEWQLESWAELGFNVHDSVAFFNEGIVAYFYPPDLWKWIDIIALTHFTTKAKATKYILKKLLKYDDWGDTNLYKRALSYEITDENCYTVLSRATSAAACESSAATREKNRLLKESRRIESERVGHDNTGSFTLEKRVVC